MLMDRTNLFSDGQPITATAASTNTIDLGEVHSTALGRDIGSGTGVPLAVAVTEAFNNLTSLTIEVEVDSTTGFGSPKTVYTSPAYALADLEPGKRFLLPEMFPTGTDERYVRLNYVVAGSSPSTGKITAGVVAARQTN